MGNTWEPSLPKGLPRETPLNTNPSTTGLPWQRTPASSHLNGFRFYDARKYSFLRKFGPDETRGMSQVHVQFRDVRTGKVTAEYVYYFSRHDVAAGIYARMLGAAKPGEHVADLEAGCDKYQKVGSFVAIPEG